MTVALVLQAAAGMALAAGIAIEVAGWHPGGWGFAGNGGAVVALVLWVLGVFTRQSRRRDQEGR